jgi:hypothetical protein
MSPASNSLVSLGDCKSFIGGITGTAQDDKITLLINIASQMIETECNRTFKETTYTQEKYDGTGTRELCLNNFPITSFTLLEKNNNADNSDNWSTIDANDYWIDTETGVLTMTTDFLEYSDNTEFDLSELKFAVGKENYRATYKAGFATIPYDLQFACFGLVNQMYVDFGQDMNVQLERLGDHEFRFFAGSGTNPITQSVIDKYRVFNI